MLKPRHSFLIVFLLILQIPAFAQLPKLSENLYDNCHCFKSYGEKIGEEIVSHFRTETGQELYVITAHWHTPAQLWIFADRWGQHGKGILISIDPVNREGAGEPNWSGRLRLRAGPELKDRFPDHVLRKIVDEVGMPALNHTGYFGTDKAYRALRAVERALVELYRNGPGEESSIDLPLARFKGSPDQRYGFDGKREGGYSTDYEQAPILDQPYTVPWKSVATGRTDEVDVDILLGNGPVDESWLESLSFRGQGGRLSTTTVDGRTTLRVQATMHGEVQPVEVHYEYSDGTGELLGKLNVVGYNPQEKKVTVVPVNNTKCPFTAQELQRELNRVFGQAATAWQVTIERDLTVEDIRNRPFKNKGTELLSNYTDDMLSVIRAYKRTAQMDDNTFYLFLVSNPEDPDRVGYFPLKRNAGFVFADRIPDMIGIYKTIAHELAHGAFRLQHPWEDRGASMTTQYFNLMDYTREGVHLHKYQWDLIHDPEPMLALLLDEDGAASEYQFLKVNIVSRQLNIKEHMDSPSFVTPGGSIITFSDMVYPSFTGLTGNEQLNKTLRKGCLLGFQHAGRTFVARFKSSQNKFYFKGYVDVNNDQSFPGNSSVEEEAEKMVLIGEENDQCELLFYTLNHNSKTYQCETELEHLTGFFINEKKLLTTISLPPVNVEDCNCLMLYEEYKNSAFMNSPILRQLITEDPCILLNLRKIGEGLGYESQMAKDLEVIGTGFCMVFASVLGSAVVLPIALEAIKDAGIYTFSKVFLRKAAQKLAEEQSKKFIEGAVIEALTLYLVAEMLEQEIILEDFALNVAIAGARNTKLVAPNIQSYAACLHGIEMETILKIINSSDWEERRSYIALLSVECLIPVLFEVAFKKRSGDLFDAAKRSSTKNIVKFLDYFKIPKSTQSDIISMVRNFDEFGRGKYWVDEVKRIASTESGYKALDILTEARFSIGRLSVGNVRRLDRIVSKLIDDAAGIKQMIKLFEGNFDVNRMLIGLEKSGATPSQYMRFMDDILKSGKFSKTITLSGGKTMNISDFINTYPGTLQEFYHFEDAGKHYFIEYFGDIDVTLQIVMDATTKLLIETESELFVGIIRKEIENYKVSVDDE